MIVRRGLRCGLAQFKLCAHFLQPFSKGFNLLLLSSSAVFGANLANSGSVLTFCKLLMQKLRDRVEVCKSNDAKSRRGGGSCLRFSADLGHLAVAAAIAASQFFTMTRIEWNFLRAVGQVC